MFSGWPTSEFAHSISAKAMAMIVGYFDESGTHGNSKAIGVCGLVGTTEEWIRIEKPWEKAIHPIKCFHATDCANQKKDFSDFDPPKSEKLAQALANLIAERRFIAVGASVYRDDWDYAASAEMKRQYRTPYHFCVCMVLLQCNDLAKEIAGGWPISFVFSKHEQYGEYTDAIHDAFVRYGDWPLVGSYSIGKPQCIKPLQAADFYSFENYQEILSQFRGEGGNAPVREELKIIARKIEMRSKILSVEDLHRIATGMETESR